MEISPAQASAFAATMATPKYAADERDYKVAVHSVFARLLSSPVVDSTDFPRVLRTIFEGAPDYDGLGFRPEERESVLQATRPIGGFNGAFANLCGGRWGVAQYIWMVPAIDLGLGDSLRDIFESLVGTKEALSARVDRFRLGLYDVQKDVRDKGGFKPKWSLVPLSLSFVGAVLGAYEPSRYTFYHATRLKHSLGRLGAAWPRGTSGERYQEICDLVQEVATMLKAHGVPVRDLIDAQSFLWLSGQGFQKSTAAERSADATDTAEAADETEPTLSIAEMATELAAQAYWDTGRAERLASLPQRSKQLLFYGPPGTGKTYVALILARLLAGEDEDHVQLAQFHPSYAYEDFVEGIRPKLRGDSGLQYEVRKGVFRRLLDQAKEYPEERFFLIIDEINRANLPRVFGELLFGLEYRGPEHPIQLPYSEEAIYIPKNLWLIGTMNTADRSIALMDAALRRRFRHVEFAPDSKALKRWLEAHGNGGIADEAVTRFEALNRDLLELLDADRLIGQSYLMREDLSVVGFEVVWSEDIEPVLSEHLFSRRDELETLKATFLN